ncbi:MAG: DUF5691 domain-containing protein [Pseudomonadota bacterium]
MSPDAILGAVMQGTGRRPLTPSGPLAEGIETGESDTASRLMALAVQAQSFDPPAAPLSFDEVVHRPDPRPVVPAAVRPLLLRLVTGKGNSVDDLAALAVANRVASKGWRLHPFDLARLSAFVAKHAEVLGIVSPADDAGAAPSDYWNVESGVDESNWALATPAIKANFIAELRRSDPAKARALVETQLSLERAPARVRLVDAMASGLSGDDRAFLESLSKDRAPSVKQAVTRLLARLPDTGASQAQIEELVSRMKQDRVGLLRKRTLIALELPANLRTQNAQDDWLALNFGSVRASSLAEAVGMSVDELVRAGRDDAALLAGLAFAACAERNWELLERIASDHAPDVWLRCVSVGLESFGLVSASDKREWITAAMPDRLRSDGLMSHHLVDLYRAMGGPIPSSKARAILKLALKMKHDQAAALTAAIALTPDIEMAAAARTLANLPPDETLRAGLLADILIRLDEGHTQP